MVVRPATDVRPSGVNISTAAYSGEATNPAYVGNRSNNPEQETYATPGEPVGTKTLAFVGPAKDHGPVTGDPEKDTVAYYPLLTSPTGPQASLAPVE